MQRFKNYLRVAKYSVTVVTVFWFTWLACAADWGVEVRWVQYEKTKEMDNVQTIVAYSVKKLEEMTTPISCNRLPIMPEPRKINRTWSPHVSWNGSATWQQVAGTSLRLFDAYYDARLSKHYIRIIATYPDHYIPKSVKLFCRIQHKLKQRDKNSVDLVEAIAERIWVLHWSNFHGNVDIPYLITCPFMQMPNGNYNESIQVSVFMKTCQVRSNNFFVRKIQPDESTYKTFTVCLKSMFFREDISQKLIEWIETNILVGVQMIDVYVDSVHENVQHVLEVYRERGILRAFHIPVSSVASATLWHRRQSDIVTYNDCLYRNIHESQIVIPLDIDEIIIPKSDDDLVNVYNQLVVRFMKKQMTVMLNNRFYFRSHQIQDDTILSTCDEKYKQNGSKNYYDLYKRRCGHRLKDPISSSFLQRSQRGSPEGIHSRCLVPTSNTLMTSAHFPITALNDNFRFLFAPTSYLQLNHYLENCNNDIRNCAQYESSGSEVDCSALRLRNNLIIALATTAPCAKDTL